MLQPGNIVICPPDMGEREYYGRVVSIDDTEQGPFQGVKFRWVTVRHQKYKTQHVWPSNRLTKL